MRREEIRSADGRSVSYQMICGNDSEAQRAVMEALNRRD